jgi:hypothetical protein
MRDFVGTGRKNITFLDEFIYAGTRSVGSEEGDGNVFIVGVDGRDPVITITPESALSPETLPKDANFIPQRMIASTTPGLRRLTKNEIDKLQASS